MSSTAVLVPWRDAGCEHRTRAFAFVLSRLAGHGWPVVIGRHEGDEPWCKAKAVADALTQTDATVLVIHDADCVVGGLAEAVEAVQGAAFAIPHRGVHRLTAEGTTRYMAGERLDDLPLAERAYLGVECGGVFVIRREVYEATGFDPRFLGFGSEDESLSFALRCLYGPPWRGKAPLIHLFHPPQERATRSFGSMESRDLRKRYARARHDPAAMRRLIAENHLQSVT